MLMSIFKLPRSRIYWASSTRAGDVPKITTRDSWEAIKINLHFNSNENLLSMNDDTDSNGLFKIQPHLIFRFQNTSNCHSNKYYAFTNK